jgi:hypothetical protein
LPTAKQKTPGKEKTLGEEASLPRANKKTLDKEKNTRHGFLCRELNGWLSAKKFLKISFFISNLFLSSTYTYIKLMLKFGTILTLFAIFNNFTSSRYFFTYVRYELQVHEMI